LRAERTRESADFRRVFSAEKIEYNHIRFSALREPPRKTERFFRAGAIEMRRRGFSAENPKSSDDVP
jgi:hypothetical protein